MSFWLHFLLCVGGNMKKWLNKSVFIWSFSYFIFYFFVIRALWGRACCGPLQSSLQALVLQQQDGKLWRFCLWRVQRQRQQLCLREQLCDCMYRWVAHLSTCLQTYRWVEHLYLLVCTSILWRSHTTAYTHTCRFDESLVAPARWNEVKSLVTPAQVSFSACCTCSGPVLLWSTCQKWVVTS